MNEKKYQVFVSSTYEDLKEERKRLFLAILKKKHIPVGMELFGAVDKEQMSYIKRFIDDSDCFVLLLGGRYGSTDDEGISYTEREYDHAVQQGKKVIALIHKNPDALPPKKRDKNKKLAKKLKAFYDKVSKDRMVSQWEDEAELIDNFHTSFDETVKEFPMIGWVRGDSVSSSESSQKIEALELENQRLLETVKHVAEKQIAKDIKMEARSATNPNVFSETEIECVSLVMDYKIEKIDMSLFKPSSSHIPIGDVLRYYRTVALPWIFRMARICRLDLKITNPYSFPINNIDCEQHLFDENGKEIKIVKLENMISKPPLNPYYHLSSTLTPETDFASSLNPKRPIILDRSRYFFPDKDQDCIFQRIFYAENITEPIKKEIKVHFRLKKVEYDFNSIISLVQFLERVEKFNDLGAFQLVKTTLGTDRKEQDSCDTQK